MSAGSAAPETITVIQDAQGRSLTKSFVLRGGRLVQRTYPYASEFRADVAAVEGIKSLAAVLDTVAKVGFAAVIRGAPGRYYPQNSSPTFRLLHPQEGLVAARTGARISTYQVRKYNLQPDHDNRWAVTWLPTFEECPRSWVIFDVDRIPVPEHMQGDWVDDPEAAVEHVRDLLPEPFQTATCWWSLSSSAAVPEPTGRVVSNTFKLKLAFWLDRPLSSTELKRWMVVEKAPVDPAVFNPIQLIYIARPRLGDDVHDPVPRRSGTLQGEVDTVEVPDLLPEADPYSYEATGAAGFEPAEGLEELIEQIRERLKDELHVREHLMAAARTYIRQHGVNVEQAPLVTALEGVAREFRSPGEVAGYGVDSMVEYVVRQERAANWMPFSVFGSKRTTGGRLPPYFGQESTNRFAVVNDQRRFLRGWISRQHVYALARREIAVLRAAAFAAEGLA
jgi:hypothetical protein